MSICENDKAIIHFLSWKRLVSGVISCLFPGKLGFAFKGNQMWISIDSNFFFPFLCFHSQRSICYVTDQWGYSGFVHPFYMACLSRNVEQLFHLANRYKHRMEGLWFTTIKLAAEVVTQLKRHLCNKENNSKKMSKTTSKVNCCNALIIHCAPRYSAH